MQELLSLANTMADEAGQVIRRYFRQPFDIESKQDATPVTVADRAVEAALRKIIEEKFPEDGILGEEYGIKDSKNGRMWVFDPIDGTKSFIVGRPSFGTLIALCEDGVPVLGLIDQPISKERWTGAHSLPTMFNGVPVKTRACKNLKDAVMTSTSPRQVAALWPHMYAQSKAVVWGGDCYSYGLMANGWLDVSIETGLGPYDYAALPPIIEGAGGWMGDWAGRPLTLSSDGSAIAIGDPALKDEILNFIKQ